MKFSRAESRKLIINNIAQHIWSPENNLAIIHDTNIDGLEHVCRQLHCINLTYDDNVDIVVIRVLTVLESFKSWN